MLSTWRVAKNLGGLLLLGTVGLGACGGKASEHGRDDPSGGADPSGDGDQGDGDSGSETGGLGGEGSSAGDGDGSGGAESGLGGESSYSGGRSKGSGGDRGDCDDEDAPQVEVCGLNDRGERKRTCAGGEWGEWTACEDPDECEVGQGRQVTCDEPGTARIQPQRCRDGYWEDSDSCLLPCPDDQEYDALARACLTPVACDATKSDFGGGIGTAEDPYVICSAQQLQAVAYAPSAHFVLARSLYLGKLEDFVPLGTTSAPFRGVFDGRGRALEELTWNGLVPGGLFGVVDDGTIRTLVLTGFEVRGESVVGALAGWAQNESFISGVQVKGGHVSGTSEVGGLVGRLSQSNVVASTAMSDVAATGDMVGGLVGHVHDASSVDGRWTGTAISGNSMVGGLVGNLHASSSVAGYVYGNVTATGDMVGGLVGNNSGSLIHRGCSAGGSVTGQHSVGGLVGANTDAALEGSWSQSVVSGAGDSVGGLVGHNENSPLTDCYHSSDTTGKGEAVGGLVGHNLNSAISHCRASYMASGDANVGGLVGHNDGSPISESFALGEVSGTGDAVGGLVGYNLGSEVSDCFAHSEVAGNNVVGGLVGRNENSVLQHSYAKGSVLGNGAVGGLVGSNVGSGVLACFAPEEAASNLLGETTGSAALVDSLLIPLASFAEPTVFSNVGWDFTGTWLMDPLGHPILQWMQ